MIKKLNKTVWQVKSPIFGWLNVTPDIAVSYADKQRQRVRLVNKYGIKSLFGFLNRKEKEMLM